MGTNGNNNSSMRVITIPVACRRIEASYRACENPYGIKVTGLHVNGTRIETARQLYNVLCGLASSQALKTALDGIDRQMIGECVDRSNHSIGKLKVKRHI